MALNETLETPTKLYATLALSSVWDRVSHRERDRRTAATMSTWISDDRSKSRMYLLA